MAKDPPRPKVLTPIEQANLKRLLKENDEFNAFVANSPTAQDEHRQRADEERRLRAEQARLVAEEKRAAANLVDLQLALSDVTEDLIALSYRNARGDMKRVDRAQQWLKQINPAAAAKTTPENLAEAVHVAFQAYFPEFFSEPAAPSQEQVNAALDRQRAETAKAIVNAARKARGEAPLDNIIPINISKKDT